MNQISEAKAKEKQSLMEVSLINASIFTPILKKSRKADETILGGIRNSNKLVFLDGKPSTTALSALVYFLSRLPKLENGKIDRIKLDKNGISFKYAELCKVLRIKNTTIARKGLFEELYRLGRIIYKYDDLKVTKDEKGRHVSTVLKAGIDHLFAIDFYGKKFDKSKKIAWTNKIYFHKTILDSLENDGYRFIPTQRFLELELPTAKLISNLLAGHNQTRFWEIGLTKLAIHISVSTKTERRTKQTIKTASEELKKQSLIKDFEFRKNEEGETIIKYIFR